MKHQSLLIVVLLFMLGLGISGEAGAAEFVRDANDPAAWKLEAQQGGAAAIRQEEGGLRVDITAATSQAWHVQLFQDKKQIPDGTPCVVRFTAKASAPRPIRVSSQGSVSPWKLTIKTQPQVNLTTQWQQFTVSLPQQNPQNEIVRMPMFQMGDTAGTVWIKDVSVTDGKEPAGTPQAPAPTPAQPVGKELLTAPLDAASWTFKTHSGARGSLRTENGMLRVDVEQAGTEAWHVEFHQIPKDLVEGRAYMLTIAARATAPRKLTFCAQQDPQPNEVLLPHTALNVGTEWKQYRLKFTMKKVIPNQTRLPLLQVGETPGTVYIRAISLMEESK